MERNNDRIPFDEDNYTHNINRNNERSLDRRGFLKMMAGATGVFAISTLPWGALATGKLLGLDQKDEARKKITDAADLKVGDSVRFKYPGPHDDALLIKLRENDYKAYQNACTHLRCPVLWNRDEKNLICPCHHGKFDVETGKPTAGPPRRPLPEIIVKVEKGVLYAAGVKPYEK